MIKDNIIHEWIMCIVHMMVINLQQGGKFPRGACPPSRKLLELVTKAFIETPKEIVYALCA